MEKAVDTDFHHASSTLQVAAVLFQSIHNFQACAKLLLIAVILTKFK